MKTSVVLVALLSVAALGCKKKSAEPDCAAAVNHSMALSKADFEKMPGMDAATIQQAMDLGVRRCKEDKWPADAVKCMNDAVTITDAQRCYDNLSQEQRDRMNKEAGELMTAATAKAGSSAGSAGSAAGSAGSADGSAAGSADGSAAGSAGSGSAK